MLSRSPVPARDPALDLLRSAALLRVVVWHAFALTWMTVVAAMPLMFFVAGALLAGGSSGTLRYRSFVGKRVRRLLLPFWAYAIAVAVTMIVVPLDDQRWATVGGVAWRSLSWLLPLADPVDSTWHGGWLSNHLWYLRAYLWIVLLAPLFIAYARRARLAVAVLLVGVVQLEAASRLGVPYAGAGTGRVLVGDLVTYGLFVVLGVAYSQRNVNAPLHRGWLAAGGLAATSAGVGYAVVAGLPPGGVNSSYFLIACSGLALLCAVGVAERPVRRLAALDVVARATSSISRRALTVYLWHPAAIVVAQGIIGEDVPARWVAIVAGTAVLTAVAVVAVGWVEDVAAGRQSPPRVHAFPIVRLAAVVPATAAVLALTVPVLVAPNAGAASASARAGARALPPPSYREALGNSAFARRTEPPALDAPIHLRNGKMPAKALQNALDEWVEANGEVSQISVGLVVDGKPWRGSAADAGVDAAQGWDEPFRLHSLTKTFTMVLVLQEAAAGRIQLDAPLPTIRSIRRSPVALAITPRHLLSHTSGLVDYTASPSYRATKLYGPHEAVNLALGQVLRSMPGTDVHYSNANYLYLGLLLEQVTGRPYGDLVAGIAAGVGLTSTRLGDSTPGWVGFSSGGIESTIPELTAWGAALFTPDRVLPAAVLAEASALNDRNVSLGLWPLCPCWTDAAGAKRYTAIGHEVGFGALSHYPRQMTMVVRLEPPGEALTPHVIEVGDVLRSVLRES